MLDIIEKYLKKCKDLLLENDLCLSIYNDKGYKVQLDENSILYVKNNNEVTIYLTLNNINISNFTLIQLPGCCGVCVSTRCWVKETYRNKGLNTLLNNFRMEIAKYLGYTVLLCTDKEDNKAQKRVLEKNNWKQIDQFKNKRTGNIVNIHTIHL